MKSRSEFLRETTLFRLTHAGRAIALLWYYRQSREYDERSASELSADLHDEGFPKPHVTKLNDHLRRSKFVVKGKRPKNFQLDVRRLSELDERYESILNLKKVEVTGSVVPDGWFAGTRAYLERMVYQINGAYDYGFFDACAVLCRRLMESMIIEVYIANRRTAEIQSGGVFLPLEKLIVHIKSDKSISLGRNTAKAMAAIKQLGDAAAHDRVYVTEQVDIDDLKARYRRVVNELITLNGIKK